MGNLSKDFATIRVCRMLWGNNSSHYWGFDTTLRLASGGQKVAVQVIAFRARR